jgi:hypothetical protein
MKKIIAVFLLVAVMAAGIFLLISQRSVTNQHANLTLSPDENLIFPYSMSTTSDVVKQDPATTSPSIVIQPATKKTFTTAQIDRMKQEWGPTGEPTFFGTHTEQYAIGYSALFNEVSIVIIDEPADQARSAAETALFKVLQPETPQELCEYPIYVTRKTWLTDFSVQYDIGLSVCPGNVDLQTPPQL